MPKITWITIALVVVAMLALSLGIGYNIGRQVEPASESPLAVAEEAWSFVFDNYVDRNKLEESVLSGGAIRGLIDALEDPYSSYLPPQAYERGINNLEGEFEGIGAHVTLRDERITIIAPIAGSPAEAAGIRAGDIVLEVEGTSTEGMSLYDAVTLIRGPRGTPVRLLVLHEGEPEPVEITVIRDTIELASVFHDQRDDYAVITITQFTETTAGELETILAELPEPTRGIVLDLRNNPGGLLGSVVEIAGFFLDEGVAVSVVSRDGETQAIKVNRGGYKTGLPVIVLVNGFSASGSEVLSGALRDHGRATLAGDTTFGKGSVNILHQLSDGSGIYLTTSRWTTPSGHLIEGEGIEPDVFLDLEGEDAVTWAIDYLESAR